MLPVANVCCGNVNTRDRMTFRGLAVGAGAFLPHLAQQFNPTKTDELNLALKRPFQSPPVKFLETPVLIL